MLPKTIKFLWFKLAFTAQFFNSSLTKFCFVFRITPAGHHLHKTMKSKQKKRLENKKKKMIALIEVAQLNENDRTRKKNKQNASPTATDHEPKPKRPRTESKAEKSASPELGPSGKPKLSGLELQELKKRLRERSQLLKQRPTFHLREMGTNASLDTPVDNRTPLFVSDVQHLVMYSQLGALSSYNPARWCALEKPLNLGGVAVLIFENVALDDYTAHLECYDYLNKHFPVKVEILTPDLYQSDIVHDISLIPLTSTQMRKLITRYGDLKSAFHASTEIFDRVRAVFPIKKKGKAEKSEKRKEALPDSDVFPRTQLLLSGWQMVEENFPMPIKGIAERKYADYVLTKDEYKDVTPFSKMYGLDCEMCLTEIGDNELTRVSVVDEELRTVYDKLVKPYNRITNYLTQYSGITSAMMRNVWTRIEDVQQELRELLPADAILVGQGLSNDMHALKMMHPYIIDTSVIFNLTGERARKTKLKTLSEEFLSERIQTGSAGHCSTEDSIASLKLAQLKLKKSIFFGDAVMGNVYADVRPEDDVGTLNYGTSLMRQTTRRNERTAAVVADKGVVDRYEYYMRKQGRERDELEERIKCVAERSDEAIVGKMCDLLVKRTSLCFGHVRLAGPEEEDRHAKIDAWVKVVHETTANQGLVIVMFSGGNGKNGACFIDCKQPKIQK